MKPWRINLPVFPPGEVLDNSTITEYTRCPRRGLYRYGMRRGFSGKSYTIQFGLAYHKYRETVTNLCLERKEKLNDEINQLAFQSAIEGWEDPPFDHKYGYLDQVRFIETLALVKPRIIQEQTSKSIEVLKAEDSFDVPLPYWICPDCGWAFWEEDHNEDHACMNCGSSTWRYKPRHGGRIDEFLIYHSIGGKYMIRDFKTTGYMAYNYDDKFDPNSALQGYVANATILSGQQFDGAIIETVYNTKSQKPKIIQTYKTYSKGQQEQWLASNMMERSMIQMMWARKDELGYLAFPQRTEACGDFGGCGYRDACRTGGEYELNKWLESNTIYSEWDFANPGMEVAV